MTTDTLLHAHMPTSYIVLYLNIFHTLATIRILIWWAGVSINLSIMEPLPTIQPGYGAVVLMLVPIREARNISGQPTGVLVDVGVGGTGVLVGVGVGATMVRVQK